MGGQVNFSGIGGWGGGDRQEKMRGRMTMICSLMNCWQKMDHLLYITAIFRLLQQRCLNSTNIYLKLILVIYCQTRKCIQLSQKQRVSNPRLNTVLDGSNSIRQFGPIIWDLVPLELKYICSLNSFKRGIREQKPKKCPFRFSCILSVNLVHFL